MSTFGALEPGSGFMEKLKAHGQMETWMFYLQVLLHNKRFMVREILSRISKGHYAKRCRSMLNPDIIHLKGKHLEPYKAGIRGQLVERGRISKGFPIETTSSPQKGQGRVGSVTFMNPGSPGYTGAPAIGESAATTALIALGLADRERMAEIWDFDYPSIEKPTLVHP